MIAQGDDILVLGSTGFTGGEVAKQLIAKGYKPRLLVRDPSKAEGYRGHATLYEGDYTDPQVLSKVLHGIQKLYLVSGMSMESADDEIKIVDSAKEAGVRHIVKLSVVTADHPKVPFPQLHARSEDHLRESGLGWTMLRPGNFHTNALLGWAQSIKAQDTFYYPTGDGRWASIDPADIGAVAVKALTESGHEGKVYTLTGSDLWSAQQYAAVCSEVLGKAVTFVDIPLSAFREFAVNAGIAPAYADASVELLREMREDRWIEQSKDVESVLGRQPVTFAAWLDRNRAAFV